jgi:hypothetical protein
MTVMQSPCRPAGSGSAGSLDTAFQEPFGCSYSHLQARDLWFELVGDPFDGGNEVIRCRGQLSECRHAAPAVPAGRVSGRERFGQAAYA